MVRGAYYLQAFIEAALDRLVRLEACGAPQGP